MSPFPWLTSLPVSRATTHDHICDEFVIESAMRLRNPDYGCDGHTLSHLESSKPQKRALRLHPVSFPG